jgi:carboxyl-terminal processing protease
MIKYTVENWLTPNGNWINEKGIEPTDMVELDEEYYKNSIADNDNQLQRALELVSE